MNVVEFGGALGALRDRAGEVADLTVHGRLSFVVMQTGAFAVDEEAAVARMRSTALEAVKATLAHGLGVGQWTLVAVLSGELAAVLADQAEATFRTLPGNPASVRVRFSELSLAGERREAGPPPAGTRVRVQWADGHRYPGVVTRHDDQHCLVVFDAGGQRWVKARWLTPE